MIMLAYLIPNIYIFFRIWKLFIIKKHILAYILIFIGIASIFPLSTYIGYTPVRRSLDVISTYLLPFYLYLFLTVLAFDIFLLFNLFFKFLSKERMKNPRFRKYSLAGIVFASVIIVVYGAINFNTIRVTEYSIEVPARASKAKSLRIAFVADFHIDPDTPEDFIKRFVKTANNLKPDIMLYGGDIIEGRNARGLKSKADILKQVSTKYGSYGVLGNHDRYRGPGNGDFFEEAEIKLLLIIC